MNWYVRVCLFFLGLGVAHSQEFRATITGRVLDASGGAVANAKVQVVNVSNNETSTAVSDTSGSYSIPFLRPGVYNLSATASGFKTYNRENIILQVGQIAGVNVVLEVGAVTESISVTAEAATLETQTASRVGVVNQIQVSEMPLNSRNPFMLGSMMSGVTFRGAAIWQRPFDNGAIAEWSVNGGRQSNNEFLMDGAPNNAQMGGNNIAAVPAVDTVQEFSVQQNSYDAQYGKTGGGVFNVVLKSGGSKHHGTVYEFMRRKFLDANTFQNNAVGIPRPAHRLDQYGFEADGPLYIPGLLKKDGPIKLFYMGSYEGYYELWPQFLRNSYPSLEMRNGDFSKLVTAQNQPILIYDPNTTTFVGGDPVRSPFPGNIIPASRIHPVARAVTNFMPAPNATTPGVRYSTQNVLNPDYAATDDFYNLALKFDWNIGDNNRGFLRHLSNDRTEDRCINGICSGPGTDGQQPFQRINDAYVLDWITTFSPTTVFNIRASHNRFIEKGFGRANENFDLTKLGLPQSLLSQLPGPVYFGRWNFNGYSSMGRGQSINITNTYNLMSNVTKIVGSHTMKFGIDLRRNHFIQQNSGNILEFTGETRWTQRLWNQGETTAGDGYASFLIGGIGGSSNYPVYPFFRQWYFAPYFQDDWKVTRKLTLNLGLRWDANFFPDEKYNRINRQFDATAASPIAALIPADMLARYPNLRNLRGGLTFAGVGGNPRTVGEFDRNNFQPRVGVAYALTTNTVLRGGYGLYFLNPNNDSLKTTGFSTNTPLVNTLDDGRTLLPNLLGNPYPNGINRPLGSAGGLNTFVGQNFAWFNPTMRVPYVHQFSFGIQRQVTSSSTVDISYVGSRTRKANTERDFNIPSADFLRRCNLLTGGSPDVCNALVPNPFRGLAPFAGTGLFTAANISQYQLNRPFPQFTGNLLEQGRAESNIWYNSLQINYNVRAGRNLTLLANYTLSKMVERWGYADPFNGIMQQGLYFNDRPHFFKFSTVYQLPIGRGKAIASNVSGFVNHLIGGWQVSTFTNIASGEPNNLNGNVLLLKDPRTPGGDWNGKVDWKKHQVVGFNPCVLRQFNDGRIEPQPFSLRRGCGTDRANYAWLMMADYAPGTNVPGRAQPFRSGQIRKQPLFNMDLSLAKDVYFTERLRAQIRIEAFNATNYFFFGRDSHFDPNPNSDNFGTLFPSQAWIGNGYPRQVQLGFKFYW
ncbi:MAG: carboxypeptidase regulatory-like domain-containing protein [Bryobacteraceae bacterium]|nr:carboxypeptidase regulatory-like domain-containing protein [Bryobacteraceae bacterium]MDW8379691.1 carboxypeptidase regulatory-like domain-containing protein [Bryobacterales bacterium]